MYMMLSPTIVWAEEAMTYYKLGLESSMANKRVRYFTRAVELNPNLAMAYEKRALHYYFQRKYDKAISDYSKVIDLEPHSLNAHQMLGLTFLKKGKLDLAVVQLSRAIELNPLLTPAHGYRAEAYRRQGKASEAIREASTAIQLSGDPKTMANVYKTRAKAHLELGNEALADVDFQKSVELDPRYVFVRYLTGNTSLGDMSQMGLVGIIALLFVGILRIGLPRPEKSDPDEY
jgi:tetratricopeptide (TPR) repeat protein